MFFTIIETTIPWPWKIIKNNNNPNNNIKYQEFYYNPEETKKIWPLDKDAPKKNFPKNIKDIIEKIYELVEPKCLELYKLLKNYSNYKNNTNKNNKDIMFFSEDELENGSYIVYYDFIKKKFTFPTFPYVETNVVKYMKDGTQYTVKEFKTVDLKRIPLSKNIKFKMYLENNEYNFSTIFNSTSFNKENCKNSCKNNNNGNNNEKNFKKKFMSIFINEIKKYPDVIGPYFVLSKFNSNNIDNIISKIISTNYYNNMIPNLELMKDWVNNGKTIRKLNYEEFKKELKKLVIEEIKKYPEKYSKLINRNNLSDSNIKNINKNKKVKKTLVNMSNATIVDLIENLISNPSEYENILKRHNKSLRLQNIFKIIYEINKSIEDEDIKDKIIRHLMIKLSNYENYNNSGSYYSYYNNLLIDDLIKNPKDYENIINKFKKLIKANRISNQQLIEQIINILNSEKYTQKITANVKNKLISNLKTIVPNFKKTEFAKTPGLGSIFGKK